MSSTQLFQLRLQTLSFFRCWWTVTSCYWHMQFFSWFTVTTRCSWIFNHPILPLLFYLLQRQNFPLFLHSLHLLIFPRVINSLCRCFERRVMLVNSRRHMRSSSNPQNNRTSLSLSIVKMSSTLDRRWLFPRSLKEISMMRMLIKINRRFLPDTSRMFGFRNDLHKLLNIVIDFISDNNFTINIKQHHYDFNFKHVRFHLRRRSVASAAFELNSFFMSFAYWKPSEST